MTVCIAAKSKEGVIFGIADRMNTAGDIQYESPASKIYPLTNSIVAMTAGDAAFQGALLSELRKNIANRLNENPAKWIKVKDIAELYAYFHNMYKFKYAENSLLIPIGLNCNNFIAKQHEMSESFVNSIIYKITNFDLPYVSVIIVGVDEDGSHIYAVNRDNVSCMDTIGFESIGTGARIAKSQFMLARYSVNSLLPETLFLTYTAKKRSEISPGVGHEEDMFMIGAQPGSYATLKSEVIVVMDKEYKKIIAKETKSLLTAKQEIQRFVESLSKESQPQSQVVTINDINKISK